MKHNYFRLTMRGLWRARSRIIAIFAIVALSVGFLCGLLSTTPDMYASADAYYDRTNLFDLRLLSTLGFGEEDVEAVRAVSGVRDVMPAYSADMLLQTSTTDTLISRLHSIPASGDWINSADLVEGRMPTSAGECVVEFDDSLLDIHVTVGDVLTVSAENNAPEEKLTPQTLTVVGRVTSSCYFSIERERSTVGNGSVDLIVYLPESDFAYTAYTDLLLRVEGAEALDGFSSAYHALVGETKAKIEAIRPAREAARGQAVTADARQALEEARAEYMRERADAEGQLRDAAAELADAESALADALRELEQGRADYSAGQAEFEQARREAERELAEAAQAVADGQTALREQREKAERTLADTLAQLETAERELKAARQTIVDGRGKYEAGCAELNAARATYVAQINAAEQTLTASRETLAQTKASLSAARAELDARVAEVNEARVFVAQFTPQVDELTRLIREYDLAMTELEQAKAALLTAEAELAEIRAAVKAGQITISQAELEAAAAALDVQRAEADEVAAALDRQAERVAQARTVLGRLTDAEAAIAQYENAEAELAQGEASYAAAEAQCKAGEAQLSEKKAAAEAEFAVQERALRDALDELEAGEAALAAGEQELLDGRAAYLVGRQEADAAFAAAEAELREHENALLVARVRAEEEFTRAEAELREAETALLDGETAYAAGKADYDAGAAEYAQARADAEKKFADAEAELADAEEQLNRAASAVWYIFDRKDNLAYASFDSNAAKVAAIAAVFPFFFFLVAALVALTTMTRMVDEERSLIGTLKALGYSSRRIAARYLFYAALTGVFGSVTGVAVGIRLFPAVIWNAYSMMYDLPPLKTQFLWGYVLLSSLLMIICSLFATYSACRRTLAERPAQLLQPRAPQAGRRILLEHIKPVWRRMKFTHKVTARNLFLYRKRFWMTIIGVAGCTALLVTGFGLRDSISDVVEKQFGEIFQYNLTVVMKDADSLDDALRDTLAGDAVREYLPTAMLNCTAASAEAGRREEASMMIPADPAQFGDYIRLRNRRTGEAVAFDAHSVVITEKLSEQLSLHVGDTISLIDDDHRLAAMTVTGIAENYVSAYIYLGNAVYAEAFGEEAASTVLLAVTNTPDEASRDALASKLLLDDGVSAVSFNDSIRGQFADLLSNIDYIVIVLIICAGLLAFIVLYNLININITERQREIATIKVLGFFDGEVAGYVFRETAVLTLFGTLAGLVLGIFLHAFVIRTAEIDAVMFGRSIYPFSYVISAVMTLAFGWLVNLVMLRRLRNIDMVESLKQVE